MLPTNYDKTCQNYPLAINYMSLYNRYILCSKGDFWMKEEKCFVEIEHLIKSNEINKRVRKL